VVIPVDKNAITFTIKPNNKQQLIYGIRMKIEVPIQLRFKIYNREIFLTSPAGER